MKLSDAKTIQKKNLEGKKFYYDIGCYKRCKDSITTKKGQDFVRVGEKE
jgi:hypothetical protein